MPEAVPLFRTPALNRSVLFKDLHAPGVEEGCPRIRVGTKIYIPFDGAHPADGGMTVFFNRHSFDNAMRDLVDLGEPQRRADLVTDMMTLEFLDTLPTFAPFLVRDCFEHYRIPADPLFSAVSEDEWKAIRDHIRSRFAQILSAVSGGVPHGPHSAMDRLIDKLWDLKDLPALEGLAAAFGLDPAHCARTFYAWKGILYFTWVSTEIRRAVGEMLAWLENTRPLLALYPLKDRANSRLELAHAHRLVEKMLGHVETVFTEYDDAFGELFVSGSGPQRFVKFLEAAHDHFQVCGAGLGLLQHAHEVWNNATRPFPARRSIPEATTHVLQAIKDIMPG